MPTIWAYFGSFMGYFMTYWPVGAHKGPSSTVAQIASDSLLTVSRYLDLHSAPKYWPNIPKWRVYAVYGPLFWGYTVDLLSILDYWAISFGTLASRQTLSLRGYKKHLLESKTITSHAPLPTQIQAPFWESPKSGAL